MPVAKKTAAPAAKKTTAKKPAAKKPAATRKPPAAGRKGTRKPKVIKPMSSETRSFAASVTGAAVEAAYSNEKLGVKRTAEKELTGRRTGMVSRIVLDDGTVITVTVAVRQK